MKCGALCAAILLATVNVLPAAEIPDWRNLTNGSVMLNDGYSDQPYIVKTDDGAWLAVTTTGTGVEGAGGQHVISQRSADLGKTWSPPVDVEPANGPEASYAVMLKVPYGRVYVFYNHNTDNVRQVIADKPAYPDGFCRRVDSLGHFVFKYSDDGGRTWSPKRYDVPMREFEIDRRNAYQGKLKFFWNVGRAFASAGAGFVPIHKVGGFGEGFFTSSEGALLKSGNILTERDPEKIRLANAARWRCGYSRAGGRRAHRGRAEFHGTQRWRVLLRFSDDRRILGVHIQPRRRAHLEPVAIYALRRWPLDEASARGKFRLALREREISLLVPQSRRQVYRRESQAPDDGL